MLTFVTYKSIINDLANTVIVKIRYSLENYL